MKEDATVMSFTFTLSRFLACELPDQKDITYMNTNKLKVGVEKAKTARLCCRGLIIAYFQQALADQKMKGAMA